MESGIRALTMSVLVAAASFAIHADATPQSQSGEIQLQLGHEFSPRDATRMRSKRISGR